MQKILVGNIYPTSLVRRPTLMVPCSVEEFRAAVAESAGVVSFWGHTNTIAAAQAVLADKAAKKPAAKKVPAKKPAAKKPEAAVAKKAPAAKTAEKKVPAAKKPAAKKTTKK